MILIYYETFREITNYHQKMINVMIKWNMNSIQLSSNSYRTLDFQLRVHISLSATALRRNTSSSLGITDNHWIFGGGRGLPFFAAAHFIELDVSVGSVDGHGWFFGCACTSIRLGDRKIKKKSEQRCVLCGTALIGVSVQRIQLPIL